MKEVKKLERKSIVCSKNKKITKNNKNHERKEERERENQRLT